MITAAAKNLANCQICGKLSNSQLAHCPRCSSNIHLRKPNGIQNTLAYLITACILYIPANVLPITTTTQLGREIQSTIIGGVILLWEHGSYPVALIIFIASIIVPIVKIIALFWLCCAGALR